jgi:hypothetical protein
MKLPEWLFFWRPTIVQFRTGEYAIRIWIWNPGKFEFVDLKSVKRFSWGIEDGHFSDCLSNDLDEVMDKFTRIVTKKQNAKKEKEAKRYTLIVQSPR